MIVNQWVPAAHKGDAIGDSARRVRGLLREMGHQSDLFALTIEEDLVDDVRPFADPAARQGDPTIFHYALPSVMTEAFASLPHGRVLQYHNVTPAHFFAQYHAGIFRLAQLGREEVTTLAGRTDVALGDSEYNRQELEEWGFTNTGVFPIAIDVERITRAPRRPALEKVLNDGPLNFLFVGRIVPNKKIEDHIRLAEVYKRYVDVNYRLLDANGGNVAIESGKVGFARDPNSAGVSTRALMTILLPVLLSRVPEFYVAGSFGQELDRYSETVDAVSQKQLENRTDIKPAPTQKTVAPALASTVPDLAPEPPPTPIVGCPPHAIGEAWLGRFDRAIARRDIKTILGLFAPDIVARATVRSGDRMTTLEFGREEMVQSTLSSIASLKDYQQRRVSLEAMLAEGETEATCKQLIVKSIAIGQGLMNGKPYRFEALEEYLLEQRNGEWLAVKALTTQR